MLWQYVKEQRSWIALGIGVLSVTDFVIWVDKGLQIRWTSLLYLNALLLLLFLLFFMWRFQKETTYWKQLSSQIDHLSTDWFESLPLPTFWREYVTDEVLRQVANIHTEQMTIQQQNKLLESEYTAAWIHEVKAPLTAMKLLLDSLPRDGKRRKLEVEWLRIHLLIDRQLDISRLPTLEADFVLEQTNVRTIVTEEVRELATWFREKGLAVEIEENAPDVLTDVKWCRFVLRQLLTNAIKYSPLNATIHITTKSLPTGHVVLSIQDCGPGIASHELPRIFDRGFTGGSGRIHNAATGLGLYLAKLVTEQMGIWLRVEIQEGTTMSIVFPVKNAFDKTVT